MTDEILRLLHALRACCSRLFHFSFSSSSRSGSQRFRLSWSASTRTTLCGSLPVTQWQLKTAPLLAILSDLREFAAIILLAVGALLPIVDPLGAAPIYLALTGGFTSNERIRIAKAVAVNSFLLLIGSALIGAYVLDFFGLSIPAIQVAGGIVVCAIAWSMLNNPNGPTPLARNGAAKLTPDELGERAFYPLTMPLTVGPGSISVALTLGANPVQGLRPLLVTAVAHALGILIVAVSLLP